MAEVIRSQSDFDLPVTEKEWNEIERVLSLFDRFYDRRHDAVRYSGDGLEFDTIGALMAQSIRSCLFAELRPMLFNLSAVERNKLNWICGDADEGKWAMKKVIHALQICRRHEDKRFRGLASEPQGATTSNTGGADASPTPTEVK